MTRIGMSLALLALCVGCSGAEDDGPRGDAGADSGGAAQAGAPGRGGSAGSSSGGSVSALGGGGAASALEAPDEEQALVSFLTANQYASWAKESDYHQSSGPHGAAVRVFYSPKAAQALSSGASAFPAGAAAVKELTSEGSLYGWSVWVKVEDATDNGNGFYWYERIRQSGGKDSVFGNARGSSDCVGCHAAGKDYDLSTLPFE